MKEKINKSKKNLKKEKKIPISARTTKQKAVNSAKKSSNTQKLPKNVKIKEIKIDLSSKNIMKWLMFAVFGLIFVSMFWDFSSGNKITLSQMVKDIKEQKIEKIQIEGQTLKLKYKDQDQLKFSYKENFDTLINVLSAAQISPEQIDIEVKDQSGSKMFSEALQILIPVGLTAIIFLFIFKQMRGAQDSVFSFGKNKAKLFVKGKQDVRFADVGGVDEVKQEVEEIVDFLKHPKKYQKLGAKTPKGVLLVGPAGTGKTLLAKAVAGEAGVPFLSMAGSEFMEMLVGVGASRVRDLFNTAKKSAPSIIFIDEIDAIGRQRGNGVSGGHDEREQTLNQILVEMDGFNPRDNVIVLAATNRGDLLDSALLRPGRFDRRVILDLPDIQGRQNILKIHSKGKPFAENLDWKGVAKRTVGFSGADLENMLNEAAINTARANREKITMADIEEAATKVQLGPQKKRIQSKEERTMTAYHEAGHALCAFYMKNSDQVHRISIISRGLALGFTQIPPDKDRYHETKSQLEDQAVMLLGGRVAEEVVFKEITGGAASDISKVTSLAKRMVVTYGMSELGPINLDNNADNNWQFGVRQGGISEKMQARVDEQIKKIVDNAHQRATQALTKHRDKLDLISKTLVKKETLEKEEFKNLMEG